MIRSLALLASFAGFVALQPGRALSQVTDTTKKDGKPDLGPMRVIEFETDEGTWTNVDVSPDGRTILFDLLGDLYTLPIEGGQATLLRGGRSWDYMARYSPDGKSIAYIS